MKRNVLIVDDNEAERLVLAGFLKQDYDVLSAADGDEAMRLLNKKFNTVSAVVLDIIMPGMDGFEVLNKIRDSALLYQIPIIMASSLDDNEVKTKAAALGANGFVPKPYSRDLILHTIQSAINLRENAYNGSMAWSDKLTGLLNREAFFVEAERLIKSREAGYYMISCFDVEYFKVINDQYGTENGDRVLKHIANCLTRLVESIDGLACRFNADKFAILLPASLKDSQEVAENHISVMTPKCINRSIRIRVGRYLVTDLTLSVSAMFDRASLAETSIKGRYDTYIAEYDDSMLESLRQEQSIVNEMTDALKAGEFEPWFQPQYNHVTGAIIGAEALARWRKNGKLVPPSEFISIFERSGFIYQMDQSIWRQVCMLLRIWIDEGREPLPVSVNVSRYDILQGDFVSVICGLVEEYELSVDLLRIEITESAFSDAASTVIRTVKELIAYGFTVEIDDFGSGYSSLNTLKDVPASILKLDMRFLEDTDESKRGGSILESVVRMAKWLGMAVIAEGVEEKVQADYLKSIGCHYIQGYFYAKPMPVEKYVALLEHECKEPKLSGLNTLDTLDSNEFWNPKSMETLIFNSYVGGAAIIEYHNGRIEPIRTNERFRQEFGGAYMHGVPLADIPPEGCLDKINLRLMYDNFDKAIKSKKESTCEVCVRNLDSGILYLRCTVRMIAWTNDRYLLYCVITNVTVQRLAEQQEHERNAELLDNLPCGAGLYEYDGKNLTTVYLNREYWELVGRDMKEYSKIKVFDPIHPDDKGMVLPEITDSILQKRDAVCDIRVLNGNGSYSKFHMLVRIRPKGNGKYALYAFFMPASDNSLLLAEQNKSKREKGRLDFILKNAAISVWSYNRKTGEIIQNERSREVHGYNAIISDVPASIIKSGFVHPDYVDEYLAMYERIKAGEKEVEGVFRVRNAERSGYWFEHIRYAAITDEDSEEIYFGISSDVTAAHEQDNAIHQWMTLISEMQVENNVICEFNLTKDVFVRKQGNLFHEFSYSKSDGFDNYILAWARQCVEPDDADGVVDFLQRDKLLAMHARGVLDGGIDYRAAIGGEAKWCSLNIKFVTYPADEDVRLIMVHTDINSRKADELRLIEENKHDPLTGVLNRKAFEQQVNDIIIAEPNAIHALFMIDLDDFKNINDSLGHVTGDNVLKRTASGLNALLRNDDLVGRIGGDEFMVFLNNITNREVIALRAQKVLDMMHTTIDQNVNVSGSIGIAIAKKDGDNFEKLYSCADKAAYYSKQHGKNRATFYETGLGMDVAYDKTTSHIDDSCSDAMKAWDERTLQVMDENQRLIERQEEDERYRLVIESTHIITFEWNALNGKFAASPEFSQYILSEQSGERFFSENVDVSGIHPDDRALFYGKFLEKVLSGESAQETSLRLALKNGGYRWCRLGALVSFDKAERLQKAIGIITEENVQKKQSDVQLDAIFKFMSAGVMLLEIKKPDITSLYISESYFRLENTDGLRIAEGDALRFVHPDDYHKLRNKLFICSVSGAVMEETFRVVHRDKISWRHMHAVRIPYPDVLNPVMIAVETDITDIKQRQEQLERQQILIGAVFDELNVISWFYYPDERKAVMNNTCAQEHRTRGEVGNAPNCFIADGTIHPDDAAEFLRMHRAIDNGEEATSGIIRVKRQNGNYVPRKIVYIAFLGKDAKPYCAIGVSEPA